MTIPTIGWHYQLQSRSGEITGSAVVESLIGGLATSELLAREALQNSCDATIGNNKTVVKIRQTVTTPELLQTIGMNDEFAAYISQSFVEENVSTLEVGHINLLVEDFNTVGLGGSLQDAGHDNHFMRLIYHNATASKNFHASSKGSGGSFGRGKAAYAVASNICTVFYYTTFLLNGLESVRLIGVSYAREHADNGKNHRTGRAFWGMDATEKGEFFINPISGDIAHEYAEKLGFSRRDKSEFGTSILILNCQVDPNELVSAICKWWWPRLEEKLLDVSVTLLSGEILHPTPRDNPALWEYINVYHEMSNKQPTTRIKKTTITRKDILYGCIGYTALNPGNVNDTDEELVNSIALIRAPRMVVAYETPRKISRTHAGCGVFIADQSWDNLFKRSEPPAHDKWDANSSRLSDAERTTLKDVLKQLKDSFRSFVNSLEERISESQGRAKLLERLLGDLFGGKRGLPKIAQDTSYDLFSVRNQQGSIFPTDTSRVQHVFRFSLSLKKETEISSAEAEVSVVCQLAARGSGGRAELNLPFERVLLDGNVLHNTPGQPLKIILTHSANHLEFVTIPTNATYQSNWVNTVKLVVNNESGGTDATID